MKIMHGTLAASLSAGTATMCLCWVFRRSDDAVFGATDHDQPVAFDMIDCQPQAGLSGAAFISSEGLAPGVADVSGALSSDMLTDADLQSGAWDGAQVDVWRVDWKSPDARVHVWSGRIGEVVRDGAAFSAELVSLKADLERRIGRVFTRACDADLGDARCGVDLGLPSHNAEVIVAEVLGPDRFRVAVEDGPDTTAFNGGRASLPDAGEVPVLSFASGVVVLDRAASLEAGDQIVLTVGCDKAVATCRDRFANTMNFRGFPHLPGIDAVLSGPAADGNDGGKR